MARPTNAERSTASSSNSKRAAAFLVHVLTAAGAGIALLALMEAIKQHWAAMFGWLAVALLIDGIDGPLARRLDVTHLQPNWSGESLDLVVDFTTYVFVPAYAIAASGLLLPLAAPVLGIGIVVSSALYFADKRMKTDDNHFRGFPALWNAVAFYLFLLHPTPIVASLLVAVLIASTFAPFNVIHPVRVTRLRWLTLTLCTVWILLALFALQQDFQVSGPIALILCGIALYVVGCDAILRLIKAKNA